MKIDREEVLRIARISRISVNEAEINSLISQLQVVLSYAERVTQILDEVEIEVSSNRNVNFFREDVVVPSDSQALLSRAPEHEENYIVVPKILSSK